MQLTFEDETYFEIEFFCPYLINQIGMFIYLYRYCYVAIYWC